MLDLFDDIFDHWQRGFQSEGSLVDELETTQGVRADHYVLGRKREDSIGLFEALQCYQDSPELHLDYG